ncbi:MAG: phosphate ABC transporter permease subunit PstC [Thermoproteota archaeon]|nr:phosphate ABC transporter permease subunit PstC [Candidatus Brockarchaeota archaeon]
MRTNKIFDLITLFLSFLYLTIFFTFLYELIVNSQLTWKTYGLQFITNIRWDPNKNMFGALPFIYGTITTSVFSLTISFPISIGTAIFLSEVVDPRVSGLLTAIVELIAGIPSVVIGLWGIFYLVPFVNSFLEPTLGHLAFIPLFSSQGVSGLNVMSAILILSFMITPFMVVTVKSALDSVPDDLKEAMYSLGAHKHEVIAYVSLPYIKRALVSGAILAFGRAFGETMAVVMVIGNMPNISLSLFSPGYTIPGVIANELTEAIEPLHVSSLISLALVLEAVSIIIIIAERWLVRKW